MHNLQQRGRCGMPVIELNTKLQMYYYKAPLDPNAISLNKTQKCKIGDSISQHLMIMICTRLGELPSLPDFGCKIWDYQFQTMPKNFAWQKDIEDTLLESIKKYEPRLTDVKVSIQVSEVERTHAFKKYPDIKKRAVIVVDATVAKTLEVYKFGTELFLSPISK